MSSQPWLLDKTLVCEMGVVYSAQMYPIYIGQSQNPLLMRKPMNI